MKKQPNILILMSDEHRFDISGFAGNKVVKTPNLDKLAKEGVIFNNAYTPSPVCIPARQCIAAGQLPKTCKVETFGKDLEPGYKTFAKVFTQHGYHTVAAGKLHHYGIDQMQGWKMRIAGDTEIGARYREARPTKEVKISSKWDEKKEIRRAGPGISSYAKRDELTIQATKNFIYEYFVDSFYDRATPDEPLMLYVGLLNPHYPYIADQELFDYYLNKVELYSNGKSFEHPILGSCPNTVGTIVPGEDISVREIKRAMAAYYANIETIDRQFGEVLKALEDAGQNLDQWLIIYTTDHGEMLGEHALWEKQRFFEGSVKVPLFIRYPQLFEAKECNQNVNLMDLYATMCEVCKIEIPKEVESRSLVNLLYGEDKEWQNEVISQWDWNRTMLMIKQDALKYQWYGEDMPEVLFDLAEDPLECRNFIQEEKYQKRIEKFRQRKEELGY